MKHSLLVITHYHDLPNFRIFLYLLNKFWLGEKQLKIVYNLLSNQGPVSKSQIYPEIIDALSFLDTSWHYTIYEVPTGRSDGYSHQQIFKLYYSAYPNSHYTVVFDCQNFIIDNFTFDKFFINQKIMVTEEVEDDWKGFTGLLFPITDQTKFFKPLTPWIWKNCEVFDTKNYLEDKLGNFLYLEDVRFSEYMSVGLYCTCILNNSDQYQIVSNRNLPVHYHHRYRDVEKIPATCEILKKLKVPQEEISRWATNVLLYRNVH